MLGSLQALSIMRNWNFTPDHPIFLTLAADVRLNSTSYINDQIWELKLGNSEPPSISLETNFGLRARLCRIFPRFIHKGVVVNDPAHFSRPITIHHYYPNYIDLSFKPFSSINVRLEYWVPNSQVIAGRTLLTNTSHEACEVQLEWAELLLTSAEGSRMAWAEIGMNNVLAGKTADLSPVLFLTGGAKAGNSPYPSLNILLDLPPDGEHKVQWVHASLDEMSASYNLIKDIISLNWDRELARITRINSRQLDIQTGNQDWDTAFLLSQNIAYQLFLHSSQLNKAPSFVTVRRPDQGFSLLKDGSDYNHLWNGQTSNDSYYLTNILLPSSPDLVKGLLDNFLEIQTMQGEIDWKPGLGGQLSQILATPFLAIMTLQLFEVTGEIGYLRTVYPKLLSFFLSWFSTTHDRDGDLIPEWDQTIQTGFEDLPLFSQNHPWSLGADISTVEGPDLCSYLYRECLSLLAIAKLINNPDSIGQLESIAANLKSMVEQSWNDQYACYLYRDRDSHFSTPNETLGNHNGPGTIDIHEEFLQPVRPVIHLAIYNEINSQIQIFIHGSGSTGAHRVEHIPFNKIHWHVKSGFVTSEYSYSAIERIEVNGIQPEDSVRIQSVDLTCLDQSLLLPLWAGIPSSDRAKILINLTIMNKKKFLGSYGLRTCINFPGRSVVPEEYFGSHLPWTALIIDGLIQYGERNKAAEVFTRLMKPIVKTLKADMTLHQSYHSETGKALGAQNSLTGLIPIRTFLNILGVNIINNSKVEISGHNPFPWPVTIKFQGLTVVRHLKKTIVFFPDGQNSIIDNNEHQVINWKKSSINGLKSQ